MTNLDYLIETRTDHGLSDDGMAHILGISTSEYYGYIMGHHEVPPTLRNFCIVLNGVSHARLKMVEKLIDVVEHGA